MFPNQQIWGILQFVKGEDVLGKMSDSATQQNWSAPAPAQNDPQSSEKKPSDPNIVPSFPSLNLNSTFLVQPLIVTNSEVSCGKISSQKGHRSYKIRRRQLDIYKCRPCWKPWFVVNFSVLF